MIRGTDQVAAVVPARDEAGTVGGVVYAASDARLVDEVLVVDNSSTDATARVAGDHGARIVPAPEPGKGQAMRTGLAATTAPVVVFLDADLVGLLPAHVDSLVEPVLTGRATMACGLFDRGPVMNPLFLGALPVLTGQRALRRELFDRLTGADIRGYRVEAALNSLVARTGGTRLNRVLPGLWHRPKEEKSPRPLSGHLAKAGMMASVGWSYVRWTRPGRPWTLPAPGRRPSGELRSAR